MCLLLSDCKVNRLFFQLPDIKSTDKSISILHYLVETIEKNYPELDGFCDDLVFDIGRAGTREYIPCTGYSIKTAGLCRVAKSVADVQPILSTFPVAVIITYIGSVIHSSIGCGPEVSRRLGRAYSAIDSLTEGVCAAD